MCYFHSNLLKEKGWHLNKCILYQTYHYKNIDLDCMQDTESKYHLGIVLDLVSIIVVPN